jgi:putative nucleotidyltransferase with HDIG domain
MPEVLRVLIVEDSEEDAILITRELKKINGYDLHTTHATTIQEVTSFLATRPFDLVLCDYDLKTYDAMRVMDILEEMDLDIPFILISGIVREDKAEEVLSRGAIEYVAKDRLRRLKTVIHRQLKLNQAQDELLRAWVSALEFRDWETKGHSERVVENTVKLARRMGVSEAQVVHIRRGALLHDIGKLGVSDTILRKEGTLTEDEYAKMKMHAEIGYLLLKGVSFLKRAVDIPHYHHERWDGSGYPLGLKHTEIPLAARIFSVVDVYDAMTSHRPYRDALGQEFVVEHIRSKADVWFDPEVVRHFALLLEEQK